MKGAFDVSDRRRPDRGEIRRRAAPALEKVALSLGYLPLSDSAPLVVAVEHGWFADEGLAVSLARQPSWSALRDRLAVGALDAAPMPASMPIALTLGVGNLKVEMITAMTLGLGGNTITVSDALWERMRAADPVATATRPMTARAIAQVIAEQQHLGRAPLTFAVVFPTATHAYQLRYWLASAGIDPDEDVNLVTVPPPQMVAALQSGRVDGYCVGEPWGSLAVAGGIGRIAICAHELWGRAPEKVLAVTTDWAERHPRTHQALLRALLRACRWLDQPGSRTVAAELLVARGILDAPLEVVRRSLEGRVRWSPHDPPLAMPDFHVFHDGAATFPWRSHALWLMTQMRRWGQWQGTEPMASVAARVYRPDLYRPAARAVGLSVPTADLKVEGGHAQAWRLDADPTPIDMAADCFFDGIAFDPSTAALAGERRIAPSLSKTRLNPETSP